MSEIIELGTDGEVIDLTPEALDATLVRVLDTGRDDVVQERRLYRLSRGVPVSRNRGDSSGAGLVETTQYIVVSAVSRTMEGHPETMVFASDYRGEEINMHDLASVWEFDHDAALRAMGVGVVL